MTTYNKGMTLEQFTYTNYGVSLTASQKRQAISEFITHEKANKTAIYETGATSHAVNDLILFTDNTRELAELRDKIYTRALTPGDIVYAKFNVLGALAGNASLKNALSELLRAAIKRYKAEFKHDADQEIISIRHYDDKGNEFAKIYVSGFANWKSEHGYK